MADTDEERRAARERLSGNTFIHAGKTAEEARETQARSRAAFARAKEIAREYRRNRAAS